jgi:hypothetical protein
MFTGLAGRPTVGWENGITEGLRITGYENK